MNRSQSQMLLLMTVALFVRLFFVQTYYGWEESDYGNLAMVYGVWESGFTHYDMNHMPGYYFVGAVFYAFVRSSIWAGIGVSVLSGMGALYLVSRFAKSWSTSNAATMVLLGLMVQPEFSLYSSSSLREPLYTLYVLLAFQSLVHRRIWTYGIWSALAFSVRFEAPLYMVPMVFAVDGVGERGDGHCLCYLRLSGLGCSTVIKSTKHPYFGSHAAAVNVETGLSAEGKGVDWWLNGLTIVWGTAHSNCDQSCGPGYNDCLAGNPLCMVAIQQYPSVLDVVSINDRSLAGDRIRCTTRGGTQPVLEMDVPTGTILGLVRRTDYGTRSSQMGLVARDGAGIVYTRDGDRASVGSI